MVISQRGFAGQTLPLVVEDDERILTEEEIRFGEDGEPTVARVRFTLDEAGSRRILLRVPVQDGKRVSENNERAVEVEVREAREKILYFEGEPRFELKFLRRALADDENIQVVVLQRTAEDKFLSLDVVSYYAVVRDNRSGQAVEALSDIYFIIDRPFRRDFRQAEEQPQGGEQAGGQGGGGSLSELQRGVVAATFNLLRDRESYTPAEFSENTVSVALAQDRGRDEVASLLVQMNTRGLSQADPHFQEIAELLPVAVQDMETAEALLREENTREALPPSSGL